MTTTFTIVPPCAFINMNDRPHHHAKAKLTKAWRQAARDAVIAQNLTRRFDKAHITVAIRFPDNRRRDVGNLFPTAKACVDGCVDAGLLEDDDDTSIVGPDLRRHIPNGSPLVTVTIQELT